MKMRCRSALRVGSGIGASFLVALASAAHGQQMTPIGLAGFNKDMVVEASSTPPFTAQLFDSQWTLYEAGLPGGAQGLPPGGAFTSLADGTTQVQLQPYAGMNVLFMNASGTSGTLSLLPSSQHPYNHIAVFASSANAQATSVGTVVIHFSDGTSSSAINYNAYDWFFVTTNNALNNLGRVTLNGGFDGGAGTNPRLYQTTINLTTLGLNTKTIQSLTFTKPSNANTSVVMAVSGDVNSSAPGVCCNDDGTCAVVAPTACAGAFHTEWATCAAASCPQPGACCFADGTCTRVQAPACTAASGVAQSAGSVCQPTNPCPQPGACCFDDGHCTVLQSGACAASSGGPVYHGDGVACGAGTCPQLPWACCLTDGSCASLTQVDCASHGGTWNPSSTCGVFQCNPPNLLINPGAETNDNSGWTTDMTGGAGYVTGFDDTVHTGLRSFATSYSLSTRHQTVDLLAAGYTPDFLDSSPTIVCGEWVGTRGDQAGQYFLRFELWDANQQVITFNEHGNSGALNQLPAGTPFFFDSFSFSGYPAGVRYVNFIDGGRDFSGWGGNYGVHFDDAVVGLVVPSACCTGGTCTIGDQSTCIAGGGTVQATGTTCDSSPCGAPATGACCAGSTCTNTSADMCTGSGTSFAGAGTTCGASNTTPCCKADFNQANGVTVQDIFDFLTAWFGGDPRANINGGSLNVQDIFDFLAAWFAGC